MSVLPQQGICVPKSLEWMASYLVKSQIPKGMATEPLCKDVWTSGPRGESKLKGHF